MKVLAAMSGGVDSAVAAARLVAAGHDVTGVHLALNRNPQPYREGSRGCCSLEDAHDARRAADLLDIPFYVWDFSEQFQEEVIDDFVAEYRAGRTPNPCLRCNERIKFAAVLERGVALGFDAVATGHYARVVDNGAELELHRAADPDKDQSYVLGVLNQEQLRRSLFPLADTPKPEVRAEAEALGLKVASKPDSYDICFIPDGNTQAFLGKHIGVRPGLIVDQEGTPLREHQGVHEFTIGQRKGLDLRNPAADGRPRYVTDINAQTGVVTVGPRENLAITTIHADRLKFLHPAMKGELECEVQVRAHGSVVPCHARIDKDNDRMELSLHTPLQGVARGQAAVLYLPDPDGDIVLGSGTICGTAHS